ncbi:MAG: flagellar export chaperone FliS [Nitrosomonas sp.]|jgi:flagellar protein FliS|uniref:flagellar export chaperone FliS n=2 Tax=Nitrosomonas sp. TaxID=42353 RepID=UPI00271720F7|nr:flagellar export chaperone FliS [Nitrosomonas sp.]MBK6959353.1 flagellar export chaperone FliS [Nitrosomonas sp.]MDO9469114.1 flagellar export chaperone FliS [Nitrosomonas sp.]MDP1548594.1 flagellar export chaperone FliS [Nitrosomonas sp.]MDP1787519.1 flagellar export chaperone FliS [Nitrosomonas sp.]MDP1933693.1 flagellar export chaperone FliS [Nitrosomonas sp.]
MYFAMNNAVSAYQRIGVETGVESADPHKLILMLFEGAQEALAKARMHIQHNEIAEKGQMISKAIMIIDHGLKASLDMNAGGDLAIKLQALYDYMTHRLLVANIQNNTEIVNEVNKLLSELHGAWKEIGQFNGTQAAIKAATI